ENHNKKFSLQEIEKNQEEFDLAEFYYVYNLNATFKHGEIHLVHTYTFRLSGSVDYIYEFEYILTVANRWAHHEIDDFTLNINMDNYQDFYINQTFFKSVERWTINGSGEKISNFMKEYRMSEGDTASAFFIQNGTLQFKEKNFHPKGELFLFNPRFFSIKNTFSLENNLPFNKDVAVFFDEIENKEVLKVLQNLPY